jgi:hypothetical protein
MDPAQGKVNPKSIANDLKYKSAMQFDCFVQNCITTFLRRFRGFGLLSRQLSAVFYIGEKKSDCATGFGGQSRLPLSLSIMA